MNKLFVLCVLLSLSVVHGFHDPFFTDFTAFFNGGGFESLIYGFDDEGLDNVLVSGRYLLKHHPRDGLQNVLKAQGMDDDAVEAVRDSTIVMTISIDDEGEITMVTDNGESRDEVSFSPGAEVNVTNPLSGELTSIKAAVLSPSSLQTLATGQESGNEEIKTWNFLPSGLNLHTDFTKQNSLLPIIANQVFIRVDDDNKAKPLRLGWIS